MIKKILIIFLSVFAFSSEVIENISYDGLNQEVRKNLDLFLVDTMFKFDNMRLNLKTKYSLGKNQNIGEIFLENLEKEEESKFNIGINNNSLINKENVKNVVSITAGKEIKKDGNSLDMGAYISYDMLKNKKDILHGFTTGIKFIGKIPEYNVCLISLNEYNFNILKNKKYMANNLTGGLAIKLKKELGNIIYIEPNFNFLYKLDFATKLKFNNTDVTLKDKFNYALGGGLKLGTEVLKNDNLYNVYLDFELNKMMKGYKFIFKFNDKYRMSETKLKKDLVFGINLGGDILIKERSNLRFLTGLDIAKDVLDYKVSLGYQYLK